MVATQWCPMTNFYNILIVINKLPITTAFSIGWFLPPVKGTNKTTVLQTRFSYITFLYSLTNPPLIVTLSVSKYFTFMEDFTQRTVHLCFIDNWLCESIVDTSYVEYRVFP